MAKDNDDKAQAEAQKLNREKWEAANEERLARKQRAEGGPVSVAEATQANPNPADQKKDTPRVAAEKDAGMDENTLQQDVGLKDPKTGVQPQKAEQAGQVDDATAMSTQQHTMPPQGTAAEKAVSKPEGSKATSKAKGKGK